MTEAGTATPPQRESLLRVSAVDLDYGGVVALTDVSFDVAEGEAVALVGANGAGKSSLLAAISGLHRPIGGSIVFSGAEISHLPAHRIAALGVGLVPEGRRLFAQLTVRRNLTLGAYHQRDAELRREDLDYVVDLFPIISKRMNQRAGTLSGGEQQMVALARCLMGHPRLLMLDEPSLGVAPIVINRMFDALQEVRQRGITILLVEQNLRLALKFTDRAYVLQTGRNTLSGPSAELLESDEVRRAYLGQ